MAGSPQYVTLVANTVSTVTMDKDWDRVEVVNVDGSAEVYFTLDGSPPAVKTTGSYCLPAAICSKEVEPPSNTNSVVKLISTGTPTVCVAGL